MSGAHDGAWINVSDALALTLAAAALGVPRRVVDLVDCLMSYSPSQDWDGSPGLGPIVWPSDAELEDRLLVSADSGPRGSVNIQCVAALISVMIHR